jgi:hypothetical protein
MIGGMTPPSIIRSNQMKEGTSSEASVSSVNESPPHKIGINIRPDSFFGPAMHWNPGNGCSSRGDQASIRSVLNSADGDTSPSSVQKDSKRSVISLGPQLQRTLIPCLSLIPTDIFDTSLDLNFPVISSTPPLRFSLESPVLGTSAFAGDGPYISPVLSPLTPALKPTTTPVDSFIDIPSPTQVSGASEQQAITAVDISIETDENLSADTGMQLKDLSSDMEMIAMVSMDSLSVIKYRESLEHRGSRVSVSLGEYLKGTHIFRKYYSGMISTKPPGPHPSISSLRSNSLSWLLRSLVHPCLHLSLKQTSTHPSSKSFESAILAASIRFSPQRLT